METLKAMKRDMSKKAKRLRREGYLTGSICGKELEHSVSLQISQNDFMKYMRNHDTGSRAQIDVDGTVYDTVIKEINYSSLQSQYIDVSFQQLVQGEKINSKAEIIYKNVEAAQGYPTTGIREIEYRAYPKDLFDHVEINVGEYPIGTNLTVADLPEAKNPDIEILTAPTESVLHMAEHAKGQAEEDADSDSSETAEA